MPENSSVCGNCLRYFPPGHSDAAYAHAERCCNGPRFGSGSTILSHIIAMENSCERTDIGPYNPHKPTQFSA